MKVVLDSTVFIDYIRAKKGIFQELIELNRRGKLSLYTPTVVIYELWSGLSMLKEENRKAMKNIVKPTKIIILTRQLAEKSGELVRKGEVDVIEDAIIAATAIYLDAELATSNIKHFKKVKDLKIFKSSKLQKK